MHSDGGSRSEEECSAIGFTMTAWIPNDTGEYTRHLVLAGGRLFDHCRTPFDCELEAATHILKIFEQHSKRWH